MQKLHNVKLQYRNSYSVNDSKDFASFYYKSGKYFDASYLCTSLPQQKMFFKCSPSLFKLVHAH